MSADKLKKLESRVKQIEAWIDQWESYDSGWNKYRNTQAQVTGGEGFEFVAGTQIFKPTTEQTEGNNE